MDLVHLWIIIILKQCLAQLIKWVDIHYENQSKICLWNLARFAETFLTFN